MDHFVFIILSDGRGKPLKLTEVNTVGYYEYVSQLQQVKNNIFALKTEFRRSHCLLSWT